MQISTVFGNNSGTVAVRKERGRLSLFTFFVTLSKRWVKAEQTLQCLFTFLWFALQVDSSQFEMEPVTNGHPQHLSSGGAANRSGYSRAVQAIQTSIRNFYLNHRDPFWIAGKVVFAILYFIYFGFAMAYSFGDEGSIRLLVVTILVTVFIVARILCGLCGDGCMLPYRRIKNMVKSMSPSQKKKYARFMTW